MTILHQHMIKLMKLSSTSIISYIKKISINSKIFFLENALAPYFLRISSIQNCNLQIIICKLSCNQSQIELNYNGAFLVEPNTQALN